MKATQRISTARPGTLCPVVEWASGTSMKVPAVTSRPAHGEGRETAGVREHRVGERPTRVTRGLGECDEPASSRETVGSATRRRGNRLAIRPGGIADLRHPEPGGPQGSLPRLELYLAIVALHHRDSGIRGIGVVWVGRVASSQTPQGTPRKPAVLTVGILAAEVRTIATGRKAQAQPVADIIPGDTRPVPLTWPVTLFAVIRAIAISIAVAIAFDAFEFTCPTPIGCRSPPWSR